MRFLLVQPHAINNTVTSLTFRRELLTWLCNIHKQAWLPAHDRVSMPSISRVNPTISPIYTHLHSAHTPLLLARLSLLSFNDTI
jgi:hypothetical protein